MGLWLYVKAAGSRAEEGLPDSGEGGVLDVVVSIELGVSKLDSVFMPKDG